MKSVKTNFKICLKEKMERILSPWFIKHCYGSEVGRKRTKIKEFRRYSHEFRHCDNTSLTCGAGRGLEPFSNAQASFPKCLTKYIVCPNAYLHIK